MRLRLFVPLFASLMFLLFGCGGAHQTTAGLDDTGAQQLLTIINDYRAGQSSLPPLIYDPAVVAVTKAYATYLDNIGTPAQHQHPYSEAADLKGLPVRLTDAGISTTARAEVGRSDPNISNAQLFFNSLTDDEKATLSGDYDSIGIAHMIPPSGLNNNHYWIVDVVKKT